SESPAQRRRIPRRPARGPVQGEGARESPWPEGQPHSRMPRREEELARAKSRLQAWLRGSFARQRQNAARTPAQTPPLPIPAAKPPSPKAETSLLKNVACPSDIKD